MNLQEFFAENNKVALAFSGGVDSAYLLYAALKAGADVGVYYVKSHFQPQFEMDDAEKLSEQLQVKMKVLKVNVLENEAVKKNPGNRCYYCKRVIFSTIMEAAARDGYKVLLDGTNASDDVNDRPGMKALAELSVRSPLREAGLTKQRIRELSKEAGLFTWDKPAYACLATRIPTGTEITVEKLQKTERAEGFLASLGFLDFRVRFLDGAARIQIRKEDEELFLTHREDILKELSKDYKGVFLDFQYRA